MNRCKVLVLASVGVGAILALPSFAAPPVRSSVVQPVLSARTKPVITVGGLRFKDLNGSGKLDPYEDWRLTAEERSADLAARMTIDEKIGLMVIGTQTMGHSAGSAKRVSGGGCKGPWSSDGLLCEAKMVDETNFMALPGSANFKLLQPVVHTQPTTQGIRELGIRRFILREDPDPVALTQWANRVQEVAESSRLGIPVVITSNPRNHASEALAFGFKESAGTFSTWPGTLGLAATGNLRLISDFAHMAAQEWNATGIRAGYMYQADIASDPRWFRISDTFGDDPTAVANIINTVVTGFQGGPELSRGGIIVTTKHFPGGGPRDRGMDPHYVYGQASPYPTVGSLYHYHLPPFVSAIAARSAAIMPYYALPSNARSVPQLPGGAPFDEVGFAYNRAIVQQLLRTELGFKGYVNSDSGIIMTMAWGDKIQKMDYAQRMAYAINAGVDVVSDTMDVDIIKEAYRRGLINDGRITESARRLLVPSFEMGLFEDPFRDPDAAARVVETTSRDPRVYEAHQKSVVLLKNAEHLLPLTDEKVAGRKIFVQVLGAGDRTDQALELLRRRDPGLQFTRDLKEAGLAIVFLSPANGPERRSPTIFDLQLHPETQVDIKRLAEIEAAVPTIVSINLEMPWLLGNVEPGTATLLAGFSTRADATLDVIRGRAHPSGRLPITLPRSEAAIVAAETNGPGKVNGVVSSDVPGWARPAKDNYVYTDATGAAYVTGFGLSY